MKPRKSKIMECVKSGRVPLCEATECRGLYDPNTILTTTLGTRVNPKAMPYVFRNIAERYMARWGDTTTAGTYEGLAKTVEAVLSGKDIPPMVAPKGEPKPIQRILRTYKHFALSPHNPEYPDAMVRCAQYIARVARLMYGLYRDK